MEWDQEESEMTLTGSPKGLSRVDDMVTGWQGGRGAGYARRAREGRSLRARGTSREQMHQSLDLLANATTGTYCTYLHMRMYIGT